MRITIFFLVINAFIIQGYCQSPLYLYNGNENAFINNPATSGLERTEYSFSALRQWSGIKGAPILFSMNAHGRIGKFNFYNPKYLLNKTKFKSKGRAGIGINLFSEKQNVFAFTGVNATYAYHLPVRNDIVSLGVLINYTNFLFNTRSLNPADKMDPLLNDNVFSKNYLNAGLGVAYKHKKILAGISYLHFLKNYIGNQLSLPVYFQSSFLNMNFTYQFSIERMKCKAMSTVMIANNKFIYVPELHAEFVKNNTLKLAWYVDNSVYLRYKSEFRKYFFEYSLGIPTSSVNKFTYGSHMITLGKVIDKN